MSMTHELLNHLWQSTVFAVAVGLLTLLFRKNGAHTRYWLWFAASSKFLVPFSVLSELGTYLSWRSAPATVPLVLGDFARPFSGAAGASAIPAAAAPVSAVHGVGVNWLLVVLGVWACGTIAIGARWMVRWLRLRAEVRKAAPLELNAPIQVKSSGTSIEPGVVGLFRPVLLLPEGICERLTPSQMKTILAHEMCHVRRRDNLTAAIHMLVEAVFWFHPLVWWIGRQMIVEREAACDEAVLAQSGDREGYAEALLTVCKFYVESPLDSAAGVAGADLKKRIGRIMTPRATHKLTAAKKVVLGAIATATVVAPVLIASFFATPSRAARQAREADASFQDVSIEAAQPEAMGYTIGVSPDTFAVQNYSLRQVIAWANGTESALVVGPDSLDAKYNIVAKASAPFPGVSGNEQVNAARPMVRNMLADQFQLQTHRGTQSISGTYMLTSGGTDSLPRPAWVGEPGPGMNQGLTSISGTNLAMHEFVELLSWRLGHAIIDQTGLIATYDFNVDWGTGANPAPDAAGAAAPMSHPAPDVLANALQVQMGLTLQPTTAPVEVLIVDHAASPKSLAPPRTAVPMDPAAFDLYVGHYLLSGTMLMSVSRDGAHFLTQLPGQSPVEIFPEAQGDFFAKVVGAQISFDRDDSGKVTGLVLHQAGQNLPLPRVDEATAKQMADALDAKMQQKTATPGTEEALRQDLAALAAGSPIYSRMSPELAKATRDHMPLIQRQFRSLGALTGLKFMGIDPQGSDRYVAEFEHGDVEYHIALSPDGNIKAIGFRAVP
jgi:bla regulator protein blaR1